MRAAGLSLRQNGAVQCAAHLPSWLQADKKGSSGKAAALVQFVGIEDTVDSISGLGRDLGEQLSHFLQVERISGIFQHNGRRGALPPAHGAPVADLPFVVNGEYLRLPKQGN